MNIIKNGNKNKNKNKNYINEIKKYFDNYETGQLLDACYLGKILTFYNKNDETGQLIQLIVIIHQH